MAAEFLTLLAIGISVAIATLFAVFFHGPVPGVVVSLLFAVYLAALYSDAPSIFSPTAGSRQTTDTWLSYLTDSRFWKAFTVCLFIGVMGSFGADLLFNWIKGNSVSQTVFLTWLAFLILPPAGIYAYFKVNELRHENFIQAHFVDLTFYINHYYAMPVLMESFRFKGSNTTLRTDLKWFQTVKTLVNPETIENAQDNDLADMHRLYRSDYSSAGLLIPKNSDSMELAWYSLLEDRIYKGKIKFPLNKMETQTVREPRRYEHIKGELTLYLYPQGQVSLHHRVYGKTVSDQSFSLPAIEEISEEDRNALRQAFLKQANESVDHEKLLRLIDVYQRTNYLSKIDAMRHSAG